MPSKKAAASFSASPMTQDPKTIIEIRGKALEDVKRRMRETGGGGRLSGKVGVITGAGPELGIGTAAARLFAREGAAHIYLLDYSEKDLPALAESVKSTFPKTKVTYLKADAASASAISGLVDRVLKEEGHLDFFFANAGISQPRPPAGEETGVMADLKRVTRKIEEIGEEEYMEVMRINALSVFLAVKYASKAMAQLCPEKGKTIPGGSIVLTGSVAGQKANAGPMPYSASKAAVISTAQTAAFELAGQNIRVNALCPGLIETDMTQAAFKLARMAGKMDKMGVLNPLLRQGLGHEVASAALFLVSDESSYVNGQAVPVDGGLTSGAPYVRSKL